MRLHYSATALGLTLLLAACGLEASDNAAVSNAASDASTAGGNMSVDMGNMAMPTAAKRAKGSGTVAEIDKAAGAITLDHGPIPEASWPAMKMAFKAKPELLDNVKVGDKVSFDLKLEGGTGQVTAIKKQ